jgi:hypothetical protein
VLKQANFAATLRARVMRSARFDAGGDCRSVNRADFAARAGVGVHHNAGSGNAQVRPDSSRALAVPPPVHGRLAHARPSIRQGAGSKKGRRHYQALARTMCRERVDADAGLLQR